MKKWKYKIVTTSGNKSLKQRSVINLKIVKSKGKKGNGMATSGSDKSPTTEGITTKKMATTTKNDKITRTKK